MEDSFSGAEDYYARSLGTQIANENRDNLGITQKFLLAYARAVETDTVTLDMTRAFQAYATNNPERFSLAEASLATIIRADVNPDTMPGADNNWHLQLGLTDPG